MFQFPLIACHLPHEVSLPHFQTATLLQKNPVGSSLKNATWLFLPCTRRRSPLRHSSFHPGKNSVQPTFHILRIFRIRCLTPDGRGGRFNFPGQTCPDPLIALTWRASAADNSDSQKQLGSSDTRDSPDPFSSTIKKQTPIILTTKSPELSLIFNARYARQDIPKSSQVA